MRRNVEPEPIDTGPIVRMFDQLRGCTEGRRFVDKKDAEAAIAVLSTCLTHGGHHHFAVTHEGLGIAMSTTGLACLGKRGLV